MRKPIGLSLLDVMPPSLQQCCRTGQKPSLVQGKCCSKRLFNTVVQPRRRRNIARPARKKSLEVMHFCSKAVAEADLVQIPTEEEGSVLSALVKVRERQHSGKGLVNTTWPHPCSLVVGLWSGDGIKSTARSYGRLPEERTVNCLVPSSPSKS
eukprot:3309680-Amphidinium_carterae.1